MQKTLIISCLLTLFSISSFSQVNAVDKNTVNDYFQNQQFEEAIAYLKPLFNHDTTGQLVNTYLGYSYFMQEEYPQARRHYELLHRFDSNSITANQYLAIINYGTEADKSLNFYQRLRQLEPKKASHNRRLGELWARKNNNDSARFYFEAAYAMAPADYKNVAGLAGLLIVTKEYKLADSILDIGLRADSMNDSYLRLRVKSAYEVSRFEEAVDPGEKLLSLGENSITTITHLIFCYYNLNRFQDCIRVCEYTEKEEIVTESIYYFKARSYAKLLDFEKSNQLLKICLNSAISKTAELYYYKLGENYEAMKQYKPAIAQYDTGYYLFKNPVLLYNSGRIYEADLKNIPKAKQYYSRYLRNAKPQNAEEIKATKYVRQRVNDLK
ncbi:tetratricopeptide repeat protein [Flavitalea sp.]|nr:tetratricopeptide repeat protein [Flavitalea sp.]